MESRRLLTLVIGLSMSCLSSEAAAVDAVARADARPAQAVVQTLFAALAVDDEKLAFSLLAPRVQREAGSAGAFMASVREILPAVYRPAYVVYLAAHEGPSAVQQPVHITDEDGRSWLAVFHLQRFDRRWRVAGCDLLPTDSRMTKRRGGEGMAATSMDRSRGPRAQTTINAGQTWSTCVTSHVVSSERALGRAETLAPLPFPRAIFTGSIAHRSDQADQSSIKGHRHGCT